MEYGKSAAANYESVFDTMLKKYEQFDFELKANIQEQLNWMNSVKSSNEAFKRILISNDTVKQRQIRVASIGQKQSKTGNKVNYFSDNI